MVRIDQLKVPHGIGQALAIVNPAAGRGNAVRFWGRAEKVLRDKIDLEVIHTAEPQHANEIARTEASSSGRPVIAVGGDGTINEVASGLLDAAGADNHTLPLGIIPSGSGNDFVKQLDIPVKPEDAARRLLTASKRRVDVGRAGDRYFVNGVGIGLDAAIAAEAQQIRWLRGAPLYGLAMLRVMSTFKPRRATVTLDGAVVADRELTMVTVANGPCCGGGFWLCPDARLDDGHFDVMVADTLSVVAALGLLARSLRARHLDLRAVHHHHAGTVQVTSEHLLNAHVDGEILEGTHRLDIELLAQRLTVLA
ncbi:MAG TPA: diacylglycerol kinase family protein [Longimicrobiaceae bacterium]|nr:diacylglycerol kinase family protein [Longimicrobiaceae bacterium]